MGWLHASPKRHDKDSDPKPRIRTLEKNDPLRQLPDIDEYLLLCFQLSGMYSNSGMGITRISWTELDAFIRNSGYPMNNWEKQAILEMSSDYCQWYYKGAEKGTPPPFTKIPSSEDALELMRSKVSRQWEAFGKGLEKRPIKSKVIK